MHAENIVRCLPIHHGLPPVFFMTLANLVIAVLILGLLLAKSKRDN